MIQDRQDPSGQGMFSKPGRQSAEARSMLERVINQGLNLSEKRRRSMTSGSSNSQFYDGLSDAPASSQTINGANQRNPRISRPKTAHNSQLFTDYAKKIQTNMQKASTIQPFAKQITREQVQKSYSEIKPKNNEKATLVGPVPDPFKQKPRMVWDILKVYRSQSRPRSGGIKSCESQTQIMSTTNISRNDPAAVTTTSGWGDYTTTSNSIKKRVTGIQDFGLQIDRSTFSYEKFQQVNENRFECLPESQVSTKCKHKRDYSFSKQLDREVVSAFKQDNKIPDNGYMPNFEVCKKSLGRVGPGFDKISPHKPPGNHLEGVFHGTHYEYDKWVKSGTQNSIVFKNNKLSLVPFKRQIAREKVPAHVLPGFMQNVHSRISLLDLSQKMLEENSFMDEKFMQLSSACTQRSKTSRLSARSTGSHFFQSQVSGGKTSTSRMNPKTPKGGSMGFKQANFLTQPLMMNQTFSF